MPTAPPHRAASADAIDSILHAERRSRPFQKRTHVATIDALPDGTYIAMEGQAWLVMDDALLAWSGDGYTHRRRRPRDIDMTVLTPPSIVALLRAGYQPGLHPTAYTTDNSGALA